MERYSTIVNTAFLPRLLALYRSLERHSPAFTLWVLSVGNDCSRALRVLDLDGVEVVEEEDILDPELEKIRS
ncbi:MAG: hypothetical protein M3290_12300, partial [Actinomycetota bacterium]|nr:hypothetical protein [Actinomycetota bacterium]